MQADIRPLRFGLVGAGHWARSTHAPALASVAGIELVAVFGRNPNAVAALAAEYGATPHTNIDAFLADIDAVDFSVPPDVQSAMAVRAANLGKHLLLEKPIATTEADAAELVRAVEDANVASVVFFTAHFQPEVRTWLSNVASETGWAGGNAIWLGSTLSDTNPFNTPWRRDKGGLWDLAPHAVALLWACLGPVVSVTADAGCRDLTHLVLHHESGATSTITVTIDGFDAAAGFDMFVWGEAGRWTLPEAFSGSVEALRVALAELADNARAGRTAHRCDARFGGDVVGVLAAAQRHLDARVGVSTNGQSWL